MLLDEDNEQRTQTNYSNFSQYFVLN
jgi:hypothetical protein